jgi:glycosyltransferase involved in cell wall biosynthesis
LKGDYLSATNTIRLAYLVSHPIQYQAPLLKLIANQNKIKLLTIFRSDVSVGVFFDNEFGVSMKWDTPLTEGYDHIFLKSLGSAIKFSFLSPINYGLMHILLKRRIDILWVHGWGSLFQIYAIFMARILGIKVLIRGESNLHTSAVKGWKSPLKKLFLRFLFRRVNGCLAIGSLNKDFYHHYGVSDSKIFLVPYVVDNKFFQKKSLLSPEDTLQLSSRYDLDKTRKIILFASKMIERKRAIDLLRAYFLLTNHYQGFSMPYLLFIGDGDERKVLEEIANAHTSKDFIKFLGFQNQTELPKFFSLCDVFVLPSEDEPWGLIVNEAMNAARPIIASDQVGCALDLIKNGVNGYIFKAGDHVQLAEYMLKILSSDVRIDIMGNASLNIINNWGYEQAILGMNNALESLTS